MNTKSDRIWTRPGVKVVGDDYKEGSDSVIDVEHNHSQTIQEFGTNLDTSDETDKIGNRALTLAAVVEQFVNWIDQSTVPVVMVQEPIDLESEYLTHKTLLENLPDIYNIIQLSGSTDMFNVLREELLHQTSEEDLFESWKMIDGDSDQGKRNEQKVENDKMRRLVLSIVDLDLLDTSRQNNFQKLFTALLPIFGDRTYNPSAKILLFPVNEESVTFATRVLSDLGFVFSNYQRTNITNEK